MWEAIASNRRRSWLLIGLMGVILVALGAVIGALVSSYGADYGRDPVRSGGGLLSGDSATLALGALYGAAIAGVIWLVLWLVAATQGDGILLMSAKAHRIKKEDAPQLWNVVEEMSIASGLGRVPAIYIIDESSPNAFAVGCKPERAAVAVTSGLLKRLSRDELQGVIAHEIGHICNLDIRFMTLASVMVGTIALVAQMFLHGLWYGGGSRRRSSSRGGGQLQIILLVIAIVFAILAPICARLLYFACSRRREYLADASAARYTRYPEGLAAALERISLRPGDMKTANKAVAPLYIINPLQARQAVGMFSTHPPTKQRVQILRAMGGGAGFAEYEAAYCKLMGRGKHCIGEHTLSSSEPVAIREATPEPERKQDAVERAREAVDLIDRLANFVLITCVCGVRIKVPPDLKRDSLACPRCGKDHDVPKATGDSAGKPGKPPAALRYRRKGEGWESFRCSCGHSVQLSPAFRAKATHCKKCRRKIEIES